MALNCIAIGKEGFDSYKNKRKEFNYLCKVRYGLHWAHAP